MITTFKKDLLYTTFKEDGFYLFVYLTFLVGIINKLLKTKVYLLEVYEAHKQRKIRRNGDGRSS